MEKEKDGGEEDRETEREMRVCIYSFLATKYKAKCVCIYI